MAQQVPGSGQPRRAGLGRRLDAVPRAAGAGGRAQRAAGALRRHRPGCLVAVRRADQHADDAEAGRQRPDLHAVAHDRALLADPLVPAHRSQPPPERLRPDRRGSPGVPRPHRPHPDGERDHRRGAARERLQHLLGRQEPQRAARRVGGGREPAQLAPGPRLRPLLRLHRRRDQQLVSRPWSRTTTTSTSPPCRRTATTSRRTSPTRRSRSSRTARRRRRRSRGTCGSAPAPTTPRTTLRRSTSPSTPASSTTATRPTASGCCHGWSSAASCRRARSSPTSTRCPARPPMPMDHVKPWDEPE